MKHFFILILILIILPGCLWAQRNYVNQSVLANGNWFKISTRNEGVYKMDLAFLNSVGLNVQNIASGTIRLYGNGGGMLAEKNALLRSDDLVENAIEVVDGGDGVFNGSDYILFYSTGPNVWVKDSINNSFNHQKNLFADVSYYYINIGGTGKRMATSTFSTPANTNVNSFNERIYHEVDTINFLKSGKQWYGEEFSNTPGNSLSRNFTLQVQNFVPGSPMVVRSALAARSVGANSRFDVRLNGTLVQPVNITSVSGNFLDAFAAEGFVNGQVNNIQSPVLLNYTFIPGSFNAQGWLNWFNIFCRRNLNMASAPQQTFRDWQSVGSGNSAAFSLSDVSLNAQVWEVTNPVAPIKMNRQSTTNFNFLNDASRLREYIYFNGTNFLTPAVVGKVNNQNLHAPKIVDYIIVSPPFLRSEANRLAAFHFQHSGLRVTVASTEEIFNEFSSGAGDPTAVRDFVKMFYDRAGADSTLRPKYLLLFGDASFDYKNRVSNNSNLVPAYESINSLDPLATYTSDDYFGLLDDADDINLTSPPGLLDIGIGRIPAGNAAEAKVFVDKVIHYHSPATLGNWRNQLTFVADDEDANLHLNDAEIISSTATTVNPLFNKNKIYLDAYRQESGSGGSRYPAVNQAIINQMFNGNLLWNYTGHGGSIRLAEEAVLDQDIFNQLNNPNKLPLFITATCDFAPYDDPTQKSLGENLLVQNNRGAIALTTTTRLVFAFSNRIINNNYLQFALTPNPLGQYRTLGESIRTAKNFTFNASGDIINNRKFTLLGDPAMTLAFPELRVQLNTINGRPVSSIDTLQALEKCVIAGRVTDVSGNLLPNFNGTVYTTIFDKAQSINTLANDAGSVPTTFIQQTNTIYKGKATVANGNFSFSFIVPKDINYQIGNGRISLYAENKLKDANGVFTGFAIGGAANNNFSDKQGPSIAAFLNDEKFANGGLVNENPILILKLEDSSGINTSGSGIGHDITAVINGEEKKLLVLNDFYEAELDNYRKGQVRYQLPVFEPGVHTIKIKAWDIANNSNEHSIEFTVAKSEKIQLSHVLNYPNPFTSKTSFWFEHNQPATSLKALIQIFSVSGKIVHQIQKVVQSDGNRITDIEWDGKDSYGSRLGRGVYIYKLSVTSPDGNKAEKIEKMYIL